MKELWIMVVFATVSFPQGDLTTSSAIPTTIDITTPTTTAPLKTDSPASAPPTNDIPTTDMPTTDLPTTATTETLTTDTPTTDSPTTNSPTTDTPTTDNLTTDTPTTDSPTTDTPTIDNLTTDTPTTDSPTTDTPTTDNRTTDTPTTDTQTDSPTTDTQTDSLTIDTPTTDTPTTDTPTTEYTGATTGHPTTGYLTTTDPPATGYINTIGLPTTGYPTSIPITSISLPTTFTNTTTTTFSTTSTNTSTNTVPTISNTTTTTSPTISNTTTTSPTISNTTTTSPTISNTTTTSPTISNITTTSPTISNITTTSPTISNITTTSPTISNTTTTSPTIYNTPTTSPTISNITTTSPTISTTTSTTTTSTSTTTTTSPTTSTTTTISTTTSTTTIPPLDCINGGELQSGDCICPDEWTGETCSEGNFCNSTIIGDFFFPRTTVGWSAYSEELCDEKTTSAGLSKASARCLNDTGSPMFGPPHELQCELTLSDIQGNISSSPGDLLKLAFSTQILTSQPEQLSADNITTAAQIANTLLQSANITEDIAVAAVTTISQLLNASEESTQERDAVQSLTETLEKFSLDQHSNVSLVVQPNLVVQSVQVLSDSVGIQFTALTGRSGNFVANRIHLNTNTSELIADKGGATDVQIVIKFPPVLHSKNTNYSIGFVLYQNDRFFRSRAFRASSGTSRRVISANLGQVSGLHVEMLFKPTAVHNASLYDFACVSWNYTLKDWSTYGCSKVNHSEDGLRCFCNHTTNFAVLMSFRRDFKYAEVLNWITILGCSMSIIGLSLTITFQIVTRKSRKTNPTVLLVSVCVCLLIFTLLFMLGVDNPHKQLDRPEIQKDNILPPSDTQTERDRGPCTAVAVLLQYSLLGTFTWNTLYATHVFLMIRNSLATSPSDFTAYTVAIGWGLPAVVVALTLGISYRVDDPLGYRQEEFCWLAALDPKGNFDFKLPMFWGFLIPVAFMLIFNTVMLIYFAVTTCKTNPHLTSTRHTSMKKKFLSSFSLAVVLGLSWILGYLLLITQNQTMDTILNISFCVLTTTQGLQIFILFTAKTSIVKKMMADALKSVSSVDIPLHTGRFSLWRGKSREKVESYTQLDTDLSTH
ncbi:adhesion G-protein coupled receptor G7 isoform X2 [Salmo salar]|uniref:Adhesion G-protein coupled receptor G7 isoform X2 n=1 Tax=Salmo salar TaxID=8030 RepID=A0ABM3D538_SALSA|nr:adhesion G-protein coupled receptor G7-like isoform X2 [Salmo salar]